MAAGWDDMAKDDDLLRDAREAFDEAVQAESDNRADALDDLRFARLSEQWPESVRKQRELEGRPCLTINRLPSFIRQVVNDARQNKPSIKVKPVDDKADPETAEVINGLLRNIEYISNADVAYDTAVEYAVSCGIGYLRVDIDYAHDDTFDMDVRILRVPNPFSVYGDPMSEAADSSDWNTAFIVDRMTKDAFRQKYKGAEEVDWEGAGYGSLPAPWADGETIQIAEWWTREEVARKIVQLSDGSILDAEQYNKAKDYFDLLGLTVRGERETKSWKVKQRVITGAEVLEENDWPGIYIPIVPVYGDDINVEGKRYWRSLIRDSKDAQRMLNYWRTTSTELVALAPRVPFIGPRGAFATDGAKWATINTTSHPYVEYDGPTPPQRQPLDTGASAGAMSEALAASDDMKSIMGIFDPSLGQRSNETSGIAINARKMQSSLTNFHFLDNMTRAIRHLGRVVVDLIPHVYSGPRILRVLGEDGSVAKVPVNQPITVGAESPQEELDETQQAVSRIYDLSVGRYDVVVEAGPSFATRREEIAAQMSELLRAYPPAAPLIGDLLVKSLDWPDAEEIAARFKAMLPAQIQGQGQDQAQQQMQQQVQQLQQQAGQQIQQLQQQAQALRQQLEEEKEKTALELRKLDIDAYNAETQRLKAVQTGMNPQEVQSLVLQTVQQVLSSPDILPVAPPIQPEQPEGNFFMSPTVPGVNNG
jgi:vacuolar-type H+-ATPase subunit H